MNKKAHSKSPEKVYMLLHRLSNDWDWVKDDRSCQRFLFHARDDKEAESKALGWALYHSLDRQNVKARLATPEETQRGADWYHDEWIKRL